MFPFILQYYRGFRTRIKSHMSMKLHFCFGKTSPSPFTPFLQILHFHTYAILSVHCRRMNLSLICPSKCLKVCSAFSDSNSSSVSTSMLADSDYSTDEEGGIESVTAASNGNDITVEEWQAWGTSSQIPAMVTKIIDTLKPMERELHVKLDFCGPRGKLQGQAKIKEDKKHRAIYKGLPHPEQKLQFFTARQVAYRLLGSRGYLCQNCWLPLMDCMCSKLIKHSLWQGIRFWLYMHPKDFLRKNNTGKLLWQVYGKEAAHVCIFGIQEDEEIMWNTFKLAGRDKVWCLYPEGKWNECCYVDELKIPECIASSDDRDLMMDDHLSINFILIDGTWKNSRAMLSRLKDHAHAAWGEKGLSCLALSQASVSVMHRLRPQPSLDRTCTAAAAIQLLYDLNAHQELEQKKLAQSAEVLENSLDLLLNALSSRRQRHGKPVVRSQRWKNNT